MKLHLGCGTKHLKGFINIDIRYLPGVDEVNNVKFIRNYNSNSIDLIYACHVLEHFSRWDYKNVLTRWYDVLKPNGILRLAVPNFESICKYYQSTKDLKSIMGLLYGGQDYEENYHYVIFDENNLKNDLYDIGFTNVYKYDYNTVEHFDIDDYSKSYLPHFDKNGLLMSLNLEAKK